MTAKAGDTPRVSLEQIDKAAEFLAKLRAACMDMPFADISPEQQQIVTALIEAWLKGGPCE